MLVKEITFNDFLEEFRRYEREDQFSYEAKKALFNYLNDLSDDMGQSIELDIIAICCDFTEYDSIEEFNNDYSYTIGKDIDNMEDVQNYTIVIPIDSQSFIIQDF